MKNAIPLSIITHQCLSIIEDDIALNNCLRFLRKEARMFPPDRERQKAIFLLRRQIKKHKGNNYQRSSTIRQPLKPTLL